MIGFWVVLKSHFELPIAVTFPFHERDYVKQDKQKRDEVEFAYQPGKVLEPCYGRFLS